MFVFVIDSNSFPAARFSEIGTLANILAPTLTIGGIIGFLGMLIYGSLTLMNAGGNPDQIAKAWKIFTFAIFGLLIVIFAYLLTQLAGFITQINIPL
ncbi:hypothetical protein KC726_01730 [Candidatus Woesebacteria bacterium]|nr:hypothetical protein [Candidatus Woesebacteria bacterium]